MDATIARIPASTDSIPTSVITDIHKIRRNSKVRTDLDEFCPERFLAGGAADVLVLLYEIVIEIAGLVAATSPHPMEDLCSLPGTCQTMRMACMEHVVRSHVALEREESMRDNDAEQYIKKVEGEDVSHGCKPEASSTNRGCVRRREQAVDAVREVLWRVDGTMDPVPVPPPEVGCKGSGCGVAEGWTGGYTVFCSDVCRIWHEYSEFYISLIVNLTTDT